MAHARCPVVAAAVVTGCTSTTQVNHPPNIVINSPPATVAVTSK